jgi:hypothetical protein
LWNNEDRRHIFNCHVVGPIQEREKSAMGDFDINTWLEAAQAYKRLRRRFLGCYLGLLVLLSAFPVVGIPTVASELEPSPFVRDVFSSAFAVAWCGCLMGAAVNWFKLIGFRCPKCGKRFVLSWWRSWPDDRCLHCGLDLGPAATAGDKPVVATSPWDEGIDSPNAADVHEPEGVAVRPAKRSTLDYDSERA